MITKQQQPEVRDTLVVIKDDGTSDICKVKEINHERLLAQGETEYSIPNGDVRTYISKRGRVFLLAADVDYVADCKRLAELEKSTIFRDLAEYEPPILPEPKAELSKYIPWIVVVIFGFMLCVK